MTREEKLKACELRIDGYSYEDIGQTLNYHKETVYLFFEKLLHDPALNKGVEQKIIYPALSQWMRRNRVTISGFVRESGVSRTALQSTLFGLTKPRAKTINNILRVTGLDYETAFREVADDENA